MSISRDDSASISTSNAKNPRSRRCGTTREEMEQRAETINILRNAAQKPASMPSGRRRFTRCAKGSFARWDLCRGSRISSPTHCKRLSRLFWIEQSALSAGAIGRLTLTVFPATLSSSGAPGYIFIALTVPPTALRHPSFGAQRKRSTERIPEALDKHTPPYLLQFTLPIGILSTEAVQDDSPPARMTPCGSGMRERKSPLSARDKQGFLRKSILFYIQW